MMQEEIIQKKRVAVYVRISTDEQKKNSTYLNQEEIIRRFVESRSDIFEFAWDEFWYRDLWISGTLEADERPWMSALMDDLELYREMWEKPFDMVIFYRLDRIARSLNVLLKILEKFEYYGVWYISTQESLDTSTIFGKAMVWIIWAFAELERWLIEERTHAWIARSRAKWVWTKTKYWYDRISGRPVINQQEASVIMRMFDLFVHKKYTIDEIIKDFEQLWIPRPKESEVWKWLYQWEDKTIRKYLSDETYIGKHYYCKTKTIKQNWKKVSIPLPKSEWTVSDIWHDSIIDDELFEEAQKILATMTTWDNRWQRKNKDWELKFILSEFLRCDHCKEHRYRQKMSHFKWTRSAKTTEYYVCNWKSKDKFEHGYICPVVPITKEDLENLVLHHIKNIFYQPEWIAKYLETQRGNELATKQAEFRIKRLRELTNKEYIKIKKERIREKYTELGLSKSQLDDEIFQIDSQLRENKEQLKHWLDVHQNSLRAKVYIQAIEMAKELSNIEKLLKDRQLLERILKLLVKEIIVYSREATENDKLAWRKKEDWVKQYIPYHLKIVFNLPPDIIKWFMDGWPVSPTPMNPDITMRDGKFYNAEWNLTSLSKALNSESNRTPENKVAINMGNQYFNEAWFTSKINQRPSLVI